MDAVGKPKGIVAAACRLGALTLSMPPPARHHDILRAMMEQGLDPDSADQGFLDHRGVFLGRMQASIVANEWGQTQRDLSGARVPELFSEDLW